MPTINANGSADGNKGYYSIRGGFDAKMSNTGDDGDDEDPDEEEQRGGRGRKR